MKASSSANSMLSTHRRKKSCAPSCAMSGMRRMENTEMSNIPPLTKVPETKREYAGFLKNNMREYGMLLSLVAIMAFFQVMTDGTLLQPLNLTNLVLQNSYVVIMALGMLMVIVAGHIDLSVGSGRFHRRVGSGIDGQLRSQLHSHHRDLPDRRRRHRCSPRLLGGVFPDSFVHCDPGRHAGVQRHDAGPAGGAIGGAVPACFPVAKLRLYPGTVRRRRQFAHDILVGWRGSGGDLTARARPCTCQASQAWYGR